MATVVTFGEIMVRLTTPGFERFSQATSFDISFGGAESNVAASLANFGQQSRYVTVLPDNPIGDACAQFLRSLGVDTGYIARAKGRIGVYYLEMGAAQRPTKVIYDRAHSCIAEAGPGCMDWEKAFNGADWFHWTGITPAISAGAAAACREAVDAAKALGLTVSCDLNYRSKLWKWGRGASEVMPDLVKDVDIVIGNEEDAEKVFGIKAPQADVEAAVLSAEDYRYVAEALLERFPSLKRVAITLRGSLSASHNTWSGVLFDGSGFYTAPTFDITHIVDRVGAGDAFAAGLIYSLLAGRDDQSALNFAVASGCLKHSIHRDVNLVSVQEVEDLLERGGGGRVQR